MRTKKASFLTKIVVLAILIYLSTTLLSLRSQIQSAQTEVDALNTQADAQAQENAELSDAVTNSDNPEVLERVAREKGFVISGEQILIDVSN